MIDLKLADDVPDGTQIPLTIRVPSHVPFVGLTADILRNGDARPSDMIAVVLPGSTDSLLLCILRSEP